LISDAAEEERIGLLDVLQMVTMQLFIGDAYSMIDASIQGDVDGIPEASHYVNMV
jgi:hypothetical protein